MADLSDVPTSILRLPKDEHGRPVPWYAKWYGNKPSSLAMGEGKFNRAVAGRRCFLCGERLGVRVLCWVVTPLGVTQRQSEYPPSHPDCVAHVLRGGFMGITLVGVMASYTARTFEVVSLSEGGSPKRAINLGEPVNVDWWKDGRAATPEEVAAALDREHALLQSIATRSDRAEQDLADAYARALRLLPPERAANETGAG